MWARITTCINHSRAEWAKPSWANKHEFKTIPVGAFGACTCSPLVMLQNLSRFSCLFDILIYSNTKQENFLIFCKISSNYLKKIQAGFIVWYWKISIYSTPVLINYMELKKVTTMKPASPNSYMTRYQICQSYFQCWNTIYILLTFSWWHQHFTTQYL